jgi:hypothetical protein
MQEGSPSLAWWPPSFDHVLGDARLRDLKPELEQFAVDAWRTPKRILAAHPPDQDAQLRVDLRSSSQWARLPTPVAAESGSVPTHERFRPDDCDSPQDRWKPAIQLNQEQAVMVGEPYTTTAAALQDNQLMSKHRVLGFKPYPRLEWRCQEGLKEVEQPDDPASLNDSCAASHPDEVFGMHRDAVHIHEEAVFTKFTFQPVRYTTSLASTVISAIG